MTEQTTNIAMTEEEFLSLNIDKQCEILVALAVEALPLLRPYKRAFSPASDAVKVLQEHLKNPTNAETVSRFLTHKDLNKDLSALFDFVEEDEAAIASLDIIAYATGANALDTFEKEQIYDGIPDPVLSAKPETVVAAVTSYRSLEEAGLVQPFANVLDQ